MTDRDLALEVCHYLEGHCLPKENETLDADIARYNQGHRDSAAAIRRLIDKADGGPVAPTVYAVIGALVQMDREQLDQVAKAVAAALELP